MHLGLTGHGREIAVLTQLVMIGLDLNYAGPWPGSHGISLFCPGARNLTKLHDKWAMLVPEGKQAEIFSMSFTNPNLFLYRIVSVYVDNV